MNVRERIGEITRGVRLPESRAFWIATAVALPSVAIVLSIVCWDWLSGSESGSTTIRNVGLVIAGLVALPLAIWRGIVADRQSAAARRQAEAAQLSLLNERYQKGAEMLGSEVLSVRLGGIYALERLASEHPQQYHLQTMKLFCSFVRNPTGQLAIDADLDGEEMGRNTELRADVQAVMTAIGGRSDVGRALEKGEDFTLDLRGAYLSYAQLSGANLSSADLSCANLSHANFFERRFPPPDMSEPIPSGPDQPEARPVFAGESITPELSGLEHRRANLSLSILNDADLSSAFLLGTDVSGAQLLGANLSEVSMFYVNLQKAVLMSADLSKASIFSSDLSGAQLGGANLSKAQLINTKLYGTDLFNATLQGADFSAALLSKACGEFRAVGLTQRQIDQVRINPDDPPSLAGVVEVGTRKPLVWRSTSCQE